MRRLIVLSNSGTEKPFRCQFDEVQWAKYMVPKTLTPDDVLLFEGGNDINPELYGEKPHPNTQRPNAPRDKFEQLMFNIAVKVGAGMIGICRGGQLLTALNGGKLIQHCTGHNHYHDMYDSSGDTLSSPSIHHQIMDPSPLPMDDYDVLAYSDYDINRRFYDADNKELENSQVWETEMIWYPKTKCLAIQGHPEWVGHNDKFTKYCRSLVTTYLRGKPDLVT